MLHRTQRELKLSGNCRIMLHRTQRELKLSGNCRIMLQRTQRELKLSEICRITLQRTQGELKLCGISRIMLHSTQNKVSYKGLDSAYDGERRNTYKFTLQMVWKILRHVSSSGVCLSCVIQYVIRVWERNVLYFSADGGLWYS